MTTAQRDIDLVQLIIQDHRELERSFAELERAAQSPDYRRQLLDHVIADVTRHSVAKEQFLYPTAADKVSGGKQLVERELKDNAEAERLMKDLEDVDPADAKFDQLTGRLIADLRQHFQHEEEQLLPRVKKACSPEELRTLGNSVALAKEVAPTRPHPAAPDKPPANLVIGPGVGIIDRVRDVLSGRQT